MKQCEKCGAMLAMVEGYEWTMTGRCERLQMRNCAIDKGIDKMINAIDRKQRISKIINGDKMLFSICQRVKFLKLAGMSDDKIVETVKSLNLPLRYHMFIMGNYSDILGLKFS